MDHFKHYPAVENTAECTDVKGRITSDVNKDLNLKAKARTKDQALKAKDRTKDLSFKAKAKDQGL